jgi:hypothetical protein
MATPWLYTATKPTPFTQPRLFNRDDGLSLEMKPSAPSQVASGKACGTCMMCCKLLLIKELEKPAGQWCRHAAVGKGCGIYENRPPVCQRFHCLWMLDPRLGPEWKPEKAKFFLYPEREMEEVINVAVDPAFPDAWTKPPFLAAIKNWVLEGAELGRFVKVHVGNRWFVVLPDRIVELGNIRHDFVLKRKQSPTGRTIEVRVMPPSPLTPIAKPAHPDSKNGMGD